MVTSAQLPPVRCGSHSALVAMKAPEQPGDPAHHHRVRHCVMADMTLRPTTSLA